MALRTPDDSLASQTGIVMWGFVVMSVLGILFLVMTMAFGPAFATMTVPAAGTGGPGPANPAYRFPAG
ncbi:MAG: hypothetical protein ACUVXJ_13200 [Phycisphaerae bacterium]